MPNQEMQEEADKSVLMGTRLYEQWAKDTQCFRGKIPDVLIDAVLWWYIRGQHPGNFLFSYLRAMTMMYGVVDGADKDVLPEETPFKQLYFLIRVLPAECWGTIGNVNAWLSKGGKVGEMMREGY